MPPFCRVVSGLSAGSRDWSQGRTGRAVISGQSSGGLGMSRDRTGARLGAMASRPVSGAPRDHRSRRVAISEVCRYWPVMTVRFLALEDGLRGVVHREGIRRRQVDHVARRCLSVEERPVGERRRRHLAEPVVERREPAGQGRHDGHLLGCVPGHDLGVLVIDGRPARLGGEAADVVGDKPVHRRVLGVRQVPAEHTLKRCHLHRLVQAAEQVIKGPVLEHQHNHMIDRMVSVRTWHQQAFRSCRAMSGCAALQSCGPGPGSDRIASLTLANRARPLLTRRGWN